MKQMVIVLSKAKTVKNIMDNGNKDVNMEMESMNGLMVEDIKDNIEEIKDKDMV